MATSVTINHNAGTAVTVKAPAKTVASVTVAPSSNISLGSLTNVDVSGAAQNEVLVFDQANNKFVVAPYTLDANTNIANIQGGTF